MAKVILFGETGRSVVRDARAAADAPASGAWTPDNLNANEIAAELEADDVILAARDWEDVRVVGEFNGSPGGSETITIQALRALRNGSETPPGRTWIPIGDPFVLSPALTSELVLTDGADVAFRITALTLDGASSATVTVTGGQRIRERGV